MKSLRVVFMGSPDFAVPSLELLVSSNHKIAAVVSNPDKRRDRGGHPVPTPVKKKALELKLPVIDADDLTSETFHKKMQDLNPDLFVVVAFRILPKEILAIPKIGSVNLHASLLPKYRGAAPIHWAVIRGETETGCTVFFLDEVVDSGNIINKFKTHIGQDETMGDVYGRLKNEGAKLLLQSVEQIAEGRFEKEPQDDSKATSAPKLFRENTRINFEKTAMEVHNFIRGLNPFPLAWCLYNGEKMNIHRSQFYRGQYTLKPGTLANDQGKLIVGCSEGALEILELQLPGKKLMSGLDFINGYDLSIPLE